MKKNNFYSESFQRFCKNKVLLVMKQIYRTLFAIPSYQSAYMIV